MISAYTIRPVFWYVRDASHDSAEYERERLLFHVKTGDYFAMLATVLGFVKETVQRCNANGAPMESLQAALIEKLKTDLMYLQEHYTLTPKK